MLTGEKPFIAETSIDIINQILTKEPIKPIIFNPKIPRKINSLIMSMLNKKPESRPTLKKILTTLNSIL
jgi:serine/threonine-protein kinase